MYVVGIDLGTTNSAVARMEAGGAKIIPTREGQSLTPSVVSLSRKKSAEIEIVVGRQAVNNAGRAPENTIFSIKRLMGRVYGEDKVEKVRKTVGYRLVDPTPNATDQGVRVWLGEKSFTPVEISSLILKRVKADAELALGGPVTRAVITVPAYFEERQRSATAEAGRLAGLEVLKIIDEPTAAALAFGAGREGERHRVLVYDLGGGTFDVSIVQMKGGQYVVLSIEGDNWLGGDDFDRTIVNRIVAWVKETFKVDPTEDKEFLAKAKEKAEEAKIALSSVTSFEISMSHKIKGKVGMIDVEMEVTREQFESDILPMVRKTIDLTRRAMQDLKPDDFTEVLLVGGSTAVPLVHREVCKLFGDGKVKRHINPMECVALGAARMASGLARETAAVGAAPAPVVSEITALHLGIAAVAGEHPDTFVPIIEKGTPYPLLEPKVRVFYPTEDRQKVIRIPVYEGMNKLASLNELQGTIEFPLDESINKSTEIEVSFDYNANRELTVGVRVVGTNMAVKEKLERNQARPQRSGNQTLVEDWREELDPALRAGRHFLDAYGQYMEEEDRRELQAALTQGQQALDLEHKEQGERSMLVLHNKILTSGTSSELFMAERVMQSASPEDSRLLAEATARLRAAFDRKEARMVEQLGVVLRAAVAKIIAQNRGVEKVKDRDFKDGVRTIVDGFAGR